MLRKQGARSRRGLLCARHPQGPEPHDAGSLSRRQEIGPQFCGAGEAATASVPHPDQRPPPLLSAPSR